MRIAVIGAGVAGLVAARLLHRRHDVEVFDPNAHAGGHARTVDAPLGPAATAVDVGFIVFNERTYPNFLRMVEALGVPWEWSDMSFGVQCAATGLQYQGGTLHGLFAQKRNLVSPRFWGMLRDLLRFRRASRDLLAEGPELALGEYLDRGRYGAMFREKFLAPMGAAIWSSDPGQVLDAFPARFFARFFAHHGFLDSDRPRWRTIRGGSREYVRRLAAPFADRLRLGQAVESVRRTAAGVELRIAGETRAFDKAVLALHSDEALRLLADPSAEERAILGALPYRGNEAVLHTDARMLPRRRAAWASWNYHLSAAPQPTAAVTYWMNRLQNLTTPEPLCVSLNRTAELAPERILGRYHFAHPVYTAAGMAAQARHAEISGVRNTHYCGAYWRNGFHEDGVVSALAAAAQLGAGWADGFA